MENVPLENVCGETPPPSHEEKQTLHMGQFKAPWNMTLQVAGPSKVRHKWHVLKLFCVKRHHIRPSGVWGVTHPSGQCLLKLIISENAFQGLYKTQISKDIFWLDRQQMKNNYKIQ